MHDNIRRFVLEGEVGDNGNLPMVKERIIKSHEDGMRDYGFVPALDIEPQFTLDYNPVKEVYNFTLSVYGVYVGEEKAWQLSGVMNGKPIAKSILSHR